MFEKINNKLLSKFPLLWNTRVVYLIPIILVIHVLFYLSGFMHPVRLTELSNYDLFRINGVITFSVLVTTILIILWLVFYLRNNPFKAFYTLNRSYQFFEFLILFVVFFSSSAFFLTYKQGLYDNVNRLTKEINLSEEGEVVNLAVHFMAFSEGEFDIRYCCDSIKARHVRDSIKLENNKHISSNTNESNSDMGVAATIEQQERVNAEYPDTTRYEKSYLYCCTKYIHFSDDKYPLKSGEAINEISTNWLKEGKKDSVKNLINKFELLCNKYGVNNDLDIDSIIIECFNPPRFTLNYNYGYNSYVNLNELNTSLQKVSEVRDGFWRNDLIYFMIYYALGAAIVLFTFRVTSLKSWLIGIVGVGIWAILIGLIGGTLRDEDGVLALLITLLLLFTVIAIVNINSKKNKLITGVIYNWMVWLTPFLIPMLTYLIREAYENPCYNYQHYDCPPPHEIYTWINNHWIQIHTGNIVFIVILFFFAFIPMARKWQSNPEE